MRKLFAVLALWTGVVSCHLDKLLNSEKPPSSRASPARVAFASSLSSARAGDPISPPVQVTVQDSVGRVTLRDTLVTLSLGTNPSGDSLRGTKQVRSVNGVATFADLRLDKAASGYTLTAASPQLKADTSAAFSIMPATATALAFTVQPSNTVQDSTIKPAVEVTAYDALGNMATNFTGPISVGIGTDPSVSKNATLRGQIPVTAVAGVARFTDLHIDQPGVGFTLKAGFGSATPVATSGAFNIAPGPPPLPTTGSVAVTTSTSGGTPDPDGYAFAVDGGAPQPITDNQTITLTSVATGSHTVVLSGIAANCTVSGGTSRTVTVTAGQTVSATFTVSCPTPSPTTGDLTVSAATTGGSPDLDGYLVSVDGGTARRITVNGSTTFTALSAGSHSVNLGDLASNCTVSGANPRSVTVSPGQTVTTTFAVSCPTPPPTTGDLTVSAATTGGSPDLDGYLVSVDGGTARRITVNGSTTFTGLTPGAHAVTLGDLASNCTVSGPNPQTVTVITAQTVTASFAVSCPTPPPPTGSLAVTTSTSGGTPDPDGYAFAVDGGTPQPIADNQTITLTGVATGSHTVVLSGIAANCTATGGASQTVTVTAGGTATAAFTISCTALTGSVTVSTTTTGPDQPSGYTVAVSGAASQSIGASGSVTFAGLAPGSHTVTLSGVPANCTVTGGASQTVSVTAGGTATAAFTISCTAVTGSVTVSTTTSGPDQPSGYTVAVSGAASQSIGASASVTFAGLATGSHTVTLSGVPANCTVTGGASQTVSVTAGGTATAAFTISCTALTGSVTVTTVTSGPNQPSGYTVAVSGGGSQSIGASASVTFSGLPTGSHTVTLSGAPSNCTVTGGTSQNVTVTAGGTATAAFTISCTAPNVPPVVNAGPNDHAVTGLLYSFTWSFSDGNHNGPWSYTIDWGDGSTSSGTASTEGSVSSGHTYVILLPTTFTITVTVTDASGASGSASKTVSVTLL